MTSTSVREKKSTTVRSVQSGFLIGALRAAFRTLEYLAPDLGARLALRLWCTPPRRRGGTVRPGPAAATPADPAATPTGPHDGAAFTVAVDGGTVAARAWGSGPNVYLMHGWGGWAGQLQGFVAPLVATGYRVIAFDALSHGDSGPGGLGPHRATLTEFADALVAVVRAGGPAHAIVAHSLGGAATGLAVLDGLAVDRLVLIAPMADPLPYTRAFRRELGIGEAVGGRFIRRMETLVGRSMSDFDIAGRAGRTADLPPLLVLHDRDDRVSRPGDGAALAAAWPGHLHGTTGLGHGRILRDAEIIAQVVGFVSDRS